MKPIKHLTVLLTLFVSQTGNAQFTGSAQAICSSTEPIQFSIPWTNGATSYLWTLPPGWTGPTTTPTNFNTVTPDGINGGMISAQAVNGTPYAIYMPLNNDNSRHNLISLPNSQFIYVGTDLKLHHRRWDGTQWAYTAINPANGGWGNIRVSSWLVSNDAGTNVFFKTSRNKLYYLIYSNNMWLLNSVPGAADVKNNIVWRADGVFYVGTDNNIYRAAQSGAAWTVTQVSPSGWQNNLLTGSLVLDPNPGGNIYFRANNNRIYNIYNLGASNYATPLLSDMGINCTGEIAIHNNNIYFKAPDNKIHYLVWNNGWIESTYGTNVSYSIDGFMTFDNATDKIFYKGTDAKVHNIYPVSPGSNTYADGPLDNNTNVAGDLAYMDMKVFYISKDNKIHDFLWNGTSWYDSDFPLANAKACSNQYNYFGARPGQSEEGADDHMGVTALNEISPIENLAVYPNPNDGLFTLEAAVLKTSTIEIFDFQGRKIQPSVTIENDTHCRIDLTKYPKGLYLVKLRIGMQQATQKIIVR